MDSKNQAFEKLGNVENQLRDLTINSAQAANELSQLQTAVDTSIAGTQTVSSSSTGKTPSPAVPYHTRLQDPHVQYKGIWYSKSPDTNASAGGPPKKRIKSAVQCPSDVPSNDNPFRWPPFPQDWLKKTRHQKAWFGWYVDLEWLVEIASRFDREHNPDPLQGGLQAQNFGLRYLEAWAGPTVALSIEFAVLSEKLKKKNPNIEEHVDESCMVVSLCSTASWSERRKNPPAVAEVRRLSRVFGHNPEWWEDAWGGSNPNDYDD